MRGGLTERTVGAGALLAVVIGAAFAILLSSVADLRTAQRRSLQSESVLVAANRLERLVIDLETAQRGFLLTGREEFLEPWTDALAQLPGQVATLQRLLTGGDGEQQARVRRIVEAVDSYREDYSIPTVGAARQDRASVPVDSVSREGKQRIDDLRAQFDRFTGAEQDLADVRAERTDAAIRRAITAAAVGLAMSVALIALYTGYLTTAMVRPLRLAAALAGRLAGGDLGARVPERGIGEIGALERSLNTMAGSLERSRAELASSRARVVTAGDQARRRIERDLHDGTQQRLVSLLLELRSAEAAVPADQPELRAQLARIADELTAALEDLRELARGIHPAILSEGGLGPALRALARRSAVPVELDLDLPTRLPEPVEVAAYYVVSETLANAAKHARAEVVEVAAAAPTGTLRLLVRDDGVGGATPGAGSGLLGLTDRVESLGGTISVDSPPGDGTTVRVVLPTAAR